MRSRFAAASPGKSGHYLHEGEQQRVPLDKVYGSRPEKGGRESMDQGTLKWFSPDEGYGYITPDDGGEELLFSYSATWGGGFKTLEKGERVTYRVVEGWNGPQAENVSRL
jgi:CspA family cold shock protein